ncbi:MAG: FHA domain-containing protein [Planctomycetes bacterium]|nr:FHA domain-containing protein [Planctomycetota bacterium]HNZ65854.1 FHA domain-containing protein [Planctomycetota bacterium]HPY75718.1 FHA domain-containing protein [Planctomycetota bacterium]HQB01267.1 FHA domain-containing protein [Planctomycetota bacterium]
MIPQIYIHDLQDTAVPKPSKVSVLQIKKRPQEEDSYNVIKNMLGTALWEEEANWVIFPQNLGSELLDSTIERLLLHIEQDVIIVSSSYTQNGKNQSLIFFKRGKKIQKFLQEEFIENQVNIFHVFVNTGFGDFCVYLGKELPDIDVFHSVSTMIDFFIVSVANKSNKPYIGKLIEYCYEAYIAAVYVNQAAILAKQNGETVHVGGKSAYFIPYQDIRKRRVKNLDRTEEKSLKFSLDVSLLEQGRKNQQPLYDHAKLAVPLPSCKKRYGISRNKDDWFALWNQMQESFVYGVFLEKWNVQKQDEGKFLLTKLEETFPVSFLPFRIGRTYKNEIYLQHESISKNHAEIYCQDDSYYLKDLDSRCGIFSLSQEKKIVLDKNEDVELMSEDFFWLARTHTFSVKYNDKKFVLFQWENNRIIHSVVITNFPYLLGRRNKDLKLSDPSYKSISGKHAAILEKNGKYFLHDLDSRHGTFVTPSKEIYQIKFRLESPLELYDQKVFCLSQNIFFRFIDKKIVNHSQQKFHYQIN